MVDVVERARRYVAAMPGGVAGAGGREPTWRAALALVRGFCLDEGMALSILETDFNCRCQPPWTPKDLLAKVRSAQKDARVEWGYLLGDDDEGVPIKPPPPPPPPPPPKRPPIKDLEDLWNACCRVDEDAEVRRWLENDRALDATAVAELDLARALPAKRLPSWARFRDGQTWSQKGYRVVVPLFNAAGAMVSVKARRVFENSDAPKDVPPLGFQIVDLVLADAGARELLSKGHDVSVAGRRARGRWTAWIVEGVPDFLTAATAHSDADDEPPAVFGVYSGAWRRAHADRVGDGADIAVETDVDDAGDGYFRGIAHSFAGRDVRVLRVKREAVGDAQRA